MPLRTIFPGSIIVICCMIESSLAATSSNISITEPVTPATRQDPIYREKGNNGGPVFTDKPTPSAKPVTLPPVNTSQPTQNIPANRSDAVTAVRYSIQLISPTNDTVIQNTLAGVPVSVTINPALVKGMTVEILLDGRSVQQGASTSFTIIGVNSGTHSIEALLKRGDSIVSHSATISFKAIRPGG